MELHRPVRCAIVPPAPAPYREPLFRALSQRDDLEILVIYQSSGLPSWDVAPDWFALEHPYPAMHLRSWQRGRPGRSPIVWPRGLERALDEFDPDCVVVSEYGPSSLRALLWTRRHGRALAIFTEVTPQMEPALSPPQLRLQRWIARRADAVIAVSSAARDRVIRWGVPAERVVVALQSADLAPIRAAVAIPSPSNGTPTVLSVGRLVPDKNFTTLLQAAARPEAGGVRIEIAGGGPLEPELRALAERLGVPVRFHGHLSPQELPQVYAKAEIYALLSTYEPFGVSAREAAAAGLPIVCSRNVGAVGDVALDGRNAILVDPRAVEDVAAALGRLAGDEALRRQMAEASRAVDEATDGRDVEAFATAVRDASARRSTPAGQANR
jgi:glycosyltransferase involved in cell wall biosynthesis